MKADEKGTATQGLKGAHTVSTDAKATQFTPDLRSEQADTNGLMGAMNADSIQPGKPYVSPGQVRKDDPDPYSIA